MSATSFYDDRARRTSSSMLWGAWADALGFISELTSEQNLQRRTRGRDLTQPFPWSRIIGGRQGVRVDLPAGSYSDDTQLRLATTRAITNYGFDVEAFSRVELPVWPSYALGGGRASRAAAAGMGKHNVTWSTNFFPGWENAGGNGAAMRIQPHVYAAESLQSPHFIDDVVKNAIVTHGHPRALVGAILHAHSLAFALVTGDTPGPTDWPGLMSATAEGLHSFRNNSEIASLWLPRWELVAQKNFDDAWYETLEECSEMFDRSARSFDLLRRAGADRRATSKAYEELVVNLGLDNEHTRGSGTATTVAATLLAGALPGNPRRSALVAAGRLGTDTDTIATMAASIVAAATPTPVPSAVQDHAYIENLSEGLASIASGNRPRGFPYPDLLRWKAPRSGLDSVGLVGNDLALAGMGWLQPTSEPYVNSAAVWTWMSTSFGPTMLLKHRHSLEQLEIPNHPRSASNRVVGQAQPPARSPEAARKTPAPQLPIFDETPATSVVASENRREPTLDIDLLAAGDDKTLGAGVRAFLRKPNLDHSALVKFTLELAASLKRLDGN